MFNDIIPLNIAVSQRQPVSYIPEDSEVFNNQDPYPEERMHVNFVFDYYCQRLQNDNVALEWFEKRKIILTTDIIEQFQIGFADNSLGNNFSRKDKRRSEYVRGSLQRLGILKASGFQFFQGDAVFPFFDSSSYIVGAYGRRISNECRRSHVYHHHWDSNGPTFFNRYALTSFKQVILCKSPVEALTLICAGVSNVIALMGIYRFEHAHILELESHGIQEIILAIDNTDAGNQVCGLISQSLSASNITCSRLPLPKNMDINVFAQREEDHIASLKQLVLAKFPCHQTYENLLRR